MGDSKDPKFLVGVILGAVGVAGCILVSIIFGLLFCLFWRRTRKEIRLLKYQVEKGTANVSADPNMAPLATMESTITSEVPPTATNPLPLTSVKPSITDTSRGYSSVNKLSLLPDDVRTATNLEGDTVPVESAAELLEQYTKQRADYEEKQMTKMTEMKAKRGMDSKGDPKELQVVATAVFPLSTTPPGGGGYDTIVPVARGGIDPYENPADAVTPKKRGVAKKFGESPTMQQKKMSVGVAGGSGEEYTPVFNTLPEGQVEKIHTQTHGKSGRALSDSSPTRKSPRTPSLSASYENSPIMSPNKTTNQDSPTTREPPVATDSSPEEMRRQDSTRHSNRQAAKEVVEFDPNKPRKFRVTSCVKKPLIEEIDGSLEGDGEVAGGARTKSFSVQATAAVEDKGQLAYALVNMVDKKKNRTENDAVKVEGSGVPQHYRIPISTTS